MQEVNFISPFLSVPWLTQEVMNGIWFILSLCCAVLFTRFVLCWYRQGGYDIGTKAAIALSVYFWGSTGSRGWFWFVSWTHRIYPEPPWWTTNNEWLSFLFSIIAVTGALCALRVFSPREWGEWPWVVPLLLVFTFMVYTYL